MIYSRFKNNEPAALAIAAFCWAASLVYGYLPALFGIGGGTVIPSLLAAAAILSVMWWRKARSADQQLIEQIFNVSDEWRVGVLSPRIIYINGKERKLQRIAWALNELMDQMETSQIDMRHSLARVTFGEFTRKSYPEGLHGGFKRALVDLNLVNGMLSNLTTAISDLMSALAEGDFSKKTDLEFKGRYEITVNYAMQAMQTMQTMLGDVGKVMGGIARGDINQRVKAEGRGDLGRLKDDVNLSIEALGSLNDISLIASALSEGDLTQTIDKAYPGTFGEVIAGMNGTVENLRELVGEIKESTSNINTAAKEIAAGNNDLSHRTERQASSLEETAASMEELTSTVQQNTQNARHANQLAIGASDIAGQGVAVVDRVITTMEGINESAHKVVDIISVIDSIAFQTNILALNAAVEAARAGEQGRVLQ
jgi:methyl-accepting chemotaxis protein